MSSVWNEMATKSVKAGKCAYAKHKSAIFKEMEHHTRTLFKDAGFGHLIEHLLDNDEGKILADYILLERSDPKYLIPQFRAEVRTIVPLSNHISETNFYGNHSGFINWC